MVRHGANRVGVRQERLADGARRQINDRGGPRARTGATLVLATTLHASFTAPQNLLPMNLRLRPAFALLAVSLMGCVSPPAGRAQLEKTDYGQVAGSVVNMLMENHYSMKDFDDELSRKALQNYFDYLDYSRLYFTQPEIEKFRELYETKLDDAVFNLQIKPAKAIHELYVKRVRERAVKIAALLKEGGLDFKTDQTIEISRKDAPFAPSESVLDDLWKRQITREVLQEHLNIAP